MTEMEEMDQLNKTISYTRHPVATRASQYITVFDGDAEPMMIDLDAFHKDTVTFGRKEDVDIKLASYLVSRKHGRFVKVKGQWYIEDGVDEDGVHKPSSNGVLCNNAYIQRHELGEGDVFRIDSRTEERQDNVLILVAAERQEDSWKTMPLTGERVTIGRDPSNNLRLDHITVSHKHAVLTCENGKWCINDAGSANGYMINGEHCVNKRELHEKDVIAITTTTMIFASSTLYYYINTSGVSVEAHGIVVKRGKGNKSFITSDHVSMSIKPGELVSIIGGSGAGKSTIMNVLCGYLPPAEGSVYINGCNLYQNFDAMKSLFGYVPQSDIVYNDLSLYDMLKFTSELRLPRDMTDVERDQAIMRALKTVDLEEHRDKLIKNLSGGQRKRASIAVELLPDPKLLFLDEPVSGLDPGTERDLMLSLRQMTKLGKTIILVTHSTLQLGMCDKVAFMGKGGRLCFLGNLQSALEFFEVDDVVDVYKKITDDAPAWQQKYNELNPTGDEKKDSAPAPARVKVDRMHQQSVLRRRYTKLILNDRQRLMLLLLQAPLLALLISLVANGEQFKQYEMTKSLLFALSCSAFWVGMLNAIQEICKERTILKREFMTGLSLGSYLASKIIVLGVLCLIQSTLLVLTFVFTTGSPNSGVMLPSVLEMFLTTWLTSLSATAMGLFVSALFSNPDRAMTVAPLLLMPQMLFSGLLFKLSGATEVISWFAICRWSMEGFGTTADLNVLENKIQKIAPHIEREVENFFNHVPGHLIADWALLIVFVVLFLGAALAVLPNIRKESN